ncbi:MAG: hypothetical protein ABSH51_01320 [Solirubrobacteraceae bacterium]
MEIDDVGRLLVPELGCRSTIARRVDVTNDAQERRIGALVKEAAS